MSSAFVPHVIRINCGLSTRPTTVAGKDRRVSFALDLLHDIVRQVRDGFIPMSIEHLDYLPPIGRWFDGEVVQAPDGEWELFLVGQQLPQLTPAGGDPPNPIQGLGTLPVATGAFSSNLAISFEPRNFSKESLDRMRDDAPIPLQEESRWSELPPLVFLLSIPVTWGGVKFFGAFCEELGRASAQGLAKWLKRSSDAATDPERDRLLSTSFNIAPNQSVYGFVPFRHDDEEAETFLQAAIDSLGDLAALAGSLRDEAIVGPRKTAFIFDGTSWQQAWWTDGESVAITRWFSAKSPDPSRFLGRPLLDLDPTETSELQTENPEPDQD